MPNASDNHESKGRVHVDIYVEVCKSQDGKWSGIVKNDEMYGHLARMGKRRIVHKNVF